MPRAPTLSKDRANELIDLYLTGKVAGPWLAKEFGISLPYVYRILRGEKAGVPGLSLPPAKFAKSRIYRLEAGKILRKCCRCQEWKPATRKFFYFHKGKIKYGRCKPCHIKIVVQDDRVEKMKEGMSASS